jgi:5-methylcytosine-specific restriction protein A
MLISRGRYCPTCTRVKGAARGTTTARGLGYAYQTKRGRILARDGGVCWICGLPGADTIDHLTPRARGGDSSDENLKAAHRSCNSGRRL